MPMRDSLDKVITVYFACVTAETFSYKGKTYGPRPLRVSPGIFRGFTCPPGCAGCCPRFSLDYLPEEKWPGLGVVEARNVDFNGRRVLVFSDLQADHNGYHCRHVKEDGRCAVHGRQPFSCDFELLRFIEFQDQTRPNFLNQKLFGRGWAMRRVDGERGARCEMTEPTDETVREVVRKLLRLQQWAINFGLRTKLPAIIDWVATGPHKDPEVF